MPQAWRGCAHLLAAIKRRVQRDSDRTELPLQQGPRVKPALVVSQHGCPKSLAFRSSSNDGDRHACGAAAAETHLLVHQRRDLNAFDVVRDLRCASPGTQI